MATINLLSIDWDYFFNIHSDGERMECFQAICTEDYDAGDINFAWTASYARFEDKLKNIKITPEIRVVLDSIPPSSVVYVCKSHRHAYEIFNRYVRRKDKVNLLNIDHHPDAYDGFNRREKVHCGNWLSHFMAEHDAKGNVYRWLADFASSTHCPKNLQFYNDIEKTDIRSTPWNVVVIARSDIWTPPHLDEEFINYFKPVLKNRKGKLITEDGVWRSRYSEVFIDVVNCLKNPEFKSSIYSDDECVKIKKKYLHYLEMVEMFKERELRTYLTVK